MDLNIPSTSPKPPSKTGLWLALIVVSSLFTLSLGILIGLLAPNFLSYIKPPTAVTTEISPTPDPTANWKTYFDSENGFSFMYPRGWEEEQHEVKDSGDTIRSVKLTPKPFAGQNEGVSLIVIKNKKNLTSREYVDTVTLPGQKGSVCKDFKLNTSVPPSLENLDVTIVEGLCGILNQGPTMVVTQKDHIIVMSSSFYDVVDNELVYQILSTFKFLESQSPPTPSTSPKLNYPTPSNWKKYSNDFQGLHFEFNYPPQYQIFDGDPDSGDIGIRNGNHSLLNISRMSYFGYKEYSSGSRRTWFLDAVKENHHIEPTNYYFSELVLENGNSFYKVTSDRTDSPVSDFRNFYFGIFNNKAIVVHESKYETPISQTEKYTIMQSLRVY